ncbi:MAG: tRNA lysidine(34) synthetase TilS [Acidimicrobiales bacterium]|nr:MAG: tRNA lysidine(34) synthetase TilS [Acidimicrobiales bacterium]
MSKLPAAVAQVQRAVRVCLTRLRAGTNVAHPAGHPLVLVACSGGPDSLALADAVAAIAPSVGLSAGLVSVDHGLAAGSRQRAQSVADWALRRGLQPCEAVTVTVRGTGGPESAARAARYAALDVAAQRHGAVAVLLGHTQDDQAETVLLGLARGSGARALAGMASQRGRYHRPLLGLSRACTRQAAAQRQLPVWHDPHNTDVRFTRSRLRALLPELEASIGPGVIAGLTRTAHLLRADAEYLDAAAAALLAETVGVDGSLDAVALAAQPLALRGRVLRGWVLRTDVTAGAFTAAHVARLDELLTHWHGQGPVYLPGAVRVGRRAGRLHADPAAVSG